jgi:hypothetical protein
MKTHRWIPHVVIQPRTAPVESLTGAQPTEPLVQAARGILILALVLGSLGADAAASSGYASAGHASTRQSASNIHLAASTSTISPGQNLDLAWMY